MLPIRFCERMKELLGNDYPRLYEALTGADAVRGLRVNTLKCTPEMFAEISDMSLSPLSYCDEGFILCSDIQIGTSPEHHSGMIYMQDPGAMSALCALDIEHGWRVLDMCAAPGGKSSQALAEIGEEGFLHANEYVPKRAKITVGNLERLGARNALVTSLDTSALREMYSEYFDLVICDAPCSGEGMFRKSDEAISEWSEENIKMCAERQHEILGNAAPVLKSGGFLIYSTCTYSLEENEMTVDTFLREHSDFELVPVKENLRLVSSDGVSFEGAYSKDLALCRRFYPHISNGEGQFCALLRKTCGEGQDKLLFSDTSSEPSREERCAVDKFFRDNLKEAPKGRIRRVGESLVLIPEGISIPKRGVFMSGVLLGEVQKGLLFPSHHLFSAYGKSFIRQENLTRGDSRIGEYLHGDEIEASFQGSGFCSVQYCGVPLGGGKASSGRIKNHYPKGLRNKKI